MFASMPSVRDVFDPFPEMTSQETLRDTDVSSVAKTFDYLGLNEEPRPMAQDHSFNDVGMLQPSAAAAGFRAAVDDVLQRSPPGLTVEPTSLPRGEDCNVYLHHLSMQVSARMLLRLFEPYGSIEDIQLFPQNGTAVIQFEDPAYAKAAAAAGSAYIGPYMLDMLSDQTCSPQIVWGASSPNFIEPEPALSRVVLVSTLPPGTSQAKLVQWMGSIGKIERSCIRGQSAQVTFERLEDAQAALLLDDFTGHKNGVLTHWPIRVQTVREEDIWPAQPARALRIGGSAPIVPSSDKGGIPLPSDLVPAIDSSEGKALLNQLHFRTGVDPSVSNFQSLVQHMYHNGIPYPSENRGSRRIDHAKYREMRKMLEAQQCSQAQVDELALEQLEIIVELARNYIGNTVVQRFFEQCTEDVKTRMLEILAPHLASLGIHKNGTWAAQKIIDCAKTPEQKKLIVEHIQPYTPALLLDQFGNYVVQCVLPFGFPLADFIMDAMVDRTWEIAQGRFGARSMRTCLDHPNTPREHIKRVALAIVLHCVPLATSPNGSLLLIWLFESSQLDGVPALVAPRLKPHLAQLCTHKLASAIVLRIITQTTDLSSAHLLLDALFDIPDAQILEKVLLDPVHGVLLIGRALLSPALQPDVQAQYAETVKSLLERNGLVQVPAYRRLADQVGLANECANGLYSTGLSGLSGPAAFPAEGNAPPSERWGLVHYPSQKLTIHLDTI
ncbi:hypothetical protein MNAN1_002434 [Malassezia nana]|uniref:Pumilio domain-containing protein C56F2.08c n=1 Tax=Malassezia nana TaxID=180528 RepID=A0AAF0ESE2_9BASI|nr:hypothetical protein MNAN1_002434 [Malassezia nana]